MTSSGPLKGSVKNTENHGGTVRKGHDWEVPRILVLSFATELGWLGSLLSVSHWLAIVPWPVLEAAAESKQANKSVLYWNPGWLLQKSSHQLWRHLWGSWIVSRPPKTTYARHVLKSMVFSACNSRVDCISRCHQSCNSKSTGIVDAKLKSLVG